MISVVFAPSCGNLRIGRRVQTSGPRWQASRKVLNPLPGPHRKAAHLGDRDNLQRRCSANTYDARECGSAASSRPDRPQGGKAGRAAEQHHGELNRGLSPPTADRQGVDWPRAANLQRHHQNLPFCVPVTTVFPCESLRFCATPCDAKICLIYQFDQGKRWLFAAAGNFLRSRRLWVRIPPGVLFLICGCRRPRRFAESAQAHRGTSAAKKRTSFAVFPQPRECRDSLSRRYG
jgi:hypothetical protein